MQPSPLKTTLTMIEITMYAKSRFRIVSSKPPPPPFPALFSAPLTTPALPAPAPTVPAPFSASVLPFARAT